MNLTAKNIDGIPVLELAGRIDAHTVPQVWQWIEKEKAVQPRIVIDLQEVNFIDSAALATLVKGMKQCREQGGDLCLSRLAQPVQIIFELTRLDRAFGIYDDIPAAIAAFQTTAA